MSGLKRKNTTFNESTFRNNQTFLLYYNRLAELAVSMFEWKNLPDTIDERFLELTLFTDGQIIFFNDDVMGYLALQVATGGDFNVYRIPQNRRAYAANGYNMNLNGDDSVIIYNNFMRTPSLPTIEMFANRLYKLDRTIDINTNAQKTPILIKCDDNERLTLENLYLKYDGNQPVIMGSRGLSTDSISVLKTDAPYISDKLYTLKTEIWNEALTYLGIENITTEKKERLLTDEITSYHGGTVACRYSRLESRRQACRQINKMFGLNIWCDYRGEYKNIDGGSGNE